MKEKYIYPLTFEEFMDIGRKDLEEDYPNRHKLIIPWCNAKTFEEYCEITYNFQKGMAEYAHEQGIIK